MPNGDPQSPTLGQRAGTWLRGKVWPGLDKTLSGGTQGAGPQSGPKPDQVKPVQRVESQVRQIQPSPIAPTPSYTSLPGQPIKKTP